MATIAPDTTESPRIGLARVVPRRLGAGHGRAHRGPRTGHRPAHRDRPGLARRRTSRAPPRPPRPRSRRWAATNYQERARVLRRAAEIYEANRDEFGTWTQRETGASHSKMHHESNFAYHEILNAATLPSQAYGSLMPSAVKGRLSMVRRVPAGVIGAITPWNSPSVLGMRVVGAGAGPRQRRRPQAGSADAGHRRARCSRRSSARPGCPRACSRSSSAAPTSARRSSPTRTSRSCRSPARPPVGRRVGQLAGGMLKKVSLELGGNNAFIVLDDADLDAAAAAGAFAVVPVPGPGVLRGRPAPRPSQRLADDYIERADREGAAAAHSATRTARTSSSARSSTRSSSPASTDIVQRSIEGGARVTVGRHARGPVLPTDGADRGHHRPAGLDRRDLRPGRADRRRSTRDDEAIALANGSDYGLVGVDLHALARPRPGHRRPDADRDGPHQRRHAQRRGDRSRSAAWASRATAAATAARPASTRSPSGSGSPCATSRRPSRSERRPTMASITDVARLAGVSTATVSRVVSAAPYAVSPATRERVLDAARALDYVPNALARGLLKSHIPVVGVIVHDITDPYFAEVVRGVEDAASVGGYLVITCSSDRIAERETRTSGCCARCARRRSSSPAAAWTIRPSTTRWPSTWRRCAAYGAAVVHLSPHAFGEAEIGVDNAAGHRADGRGPGRAGPPPDRVPRRPDVAVRRAPSGWPATGAGWPRPASRSTSASS